MATTQQENPAHIGEWKGAVCAICGMEEPMPWYEAPMNETIRAYARSYITPVKTFNTSLRAELEEWKLTEGLEGCTE
jgi:hypothetical protein